MELCPASSYEPAALADLFTRGYEGYVFPLVVSEEVFAFMVETFDLDLEASRVAVRDGEAVGLCNLGVRGDAGWIGGVGVVAAARRQGVARALMEAVHEQAYARGMHEITLEVIVENTGAATLYEQLGYNDVREVEVWSLPQADAETTAQETDAATAHERVRELRTTPEPWQRADGTVRHYDDVRGLVADGGAALLRIGPQGVSLLQIAGSEDAARELLAAARREGNVNVLNLWPGDTAAAALRELGGTVSVRQREMRLTL